MQEKLPQRKQIRLKEYDYSTEGYYFITICTKNRLELLGKIYNICRDGNMPSAKIKLTNAGVIVEKYIKQISNVYNYAIIDEYVIMPNHIHLILVLEKNLGKNISTIIGQFKRNVSLELKYSIWQKHFYEHIIRNEKEYYKIKEYIVNNIAKWEEDKYSGYSGRLVAVPTNNLKCYKIFINIGCDYVAKN